MLFRRLDVPGHDACRLVETAGELRLEGTAVFLDGGGATRLAYEVVAGADVVTRRGRITGWVGAREVDATVERAPGGAWFLNGGQVSGLDDCRDLDLGFTPATNALQLRRVGLAVGQRADVPVAWWDPDTATLTRLEQSYERRSELTYWYEAARFAYRALLEVGPDGFAIDYPGLWRQEP